MPRIQNDDLSQALAQIIDALPDSLDKMHQDDLAIIEQHVGRISETEWQRLKKQRRHAVATAGPRQLLSQSSQRSHRPGDPNFREMYRGGVQVNPLDVIRMQQQGWTPREIAREVGLPEGAVKNMQREYSAAQLRSQGLNWQAIAKQLGTTEAEAKKVYARGSSRFESAHDPRGFTFQSEGFEPTSVVSDANKDDRRMKDSLREIKRSLGPDFTVEANFSPDSLGGRYEVHIKNKQGKLAANPFQLGLTPRGQQLISKVGRGPGGYRLTDRGGAYTKDRNFSVRLTNAVQAASRSTRQADVVDLMNIRGEDAEDLHWARVTSDVAKMSPAGQFKELFGQQLPAVNPKLEDVTGLKMPSYVYQGGAYPQRARAIIPGNVFTRNKEGAITHYSSQAGISKRIKRDNLTVNRKTDIWGPHPGASYPTMKQHMLGQVGTTPDTVYPVSALMLGKNLLPEGQLWIDKHLAGHTWSPFDYNQEKYQVIIPSGYTHTDVLKNLGLLNKQGEFKPRRLKSGEIVESTPHGVRYNWAQNNDYANITGYKLVSRTGDRGQQLTAIQLEGYTGNMVNVTTGLKAYGLKHTNVNKDIRGRMGIDADMVMNRPSDATVAMINSLNALPRRDLEDLWERTHGHRNVPHRITPNNLRDAAKAYGQLYLSNYKEHIIPDQLMTAGDLKRLSDAGYVMQETIRGVEAPFKGSEEMWRASLRVKGSIMPVGAKMVTDVNDPKKGNLSHEALTDLDYNMPGLGEDMRRRGEPRRRIYNTIFEAAQLNKDPLYKGGSSIAHVLSDIKSEPFRKAALKRRDVVLTEMLPDSLIEKFSMNRMSPKDERAMAQLTRKAGAIAIEQLYTEQFGEDTFIMEFASSKLGGRQYLLNPGATEQFGYVDEEHIARHSKIADEGREALQHAFDAILGMELGQNMMARRGASSAIEAAINAQPAQTELLRGLGARKKWFGTSHKSIATHVHASDWGVPRNAAFTSWDNIGRMFNIDTSTPAGRKLANELATEGKLRFGGGRNPFSHPMLQLATVGAMLTPDIAKAMDLDLDLRNDAIIFHPEMVMRQGGDNDMDQSQIFGIDQYVKGKGMVNRFPLTPASQITMDAIRHSSGEYWDAIKKMNLEEQEALSKVLGYKPTEGVSKLALTGATEQQVAEQSFQEWMLNRVQIGQAYNLPIKIAQHLSKHNDARYLISQHAGTLYQNPLDKTNYAPGSPEHKMFAFMSSYNPALKNWNYQGKFKNPKRQSEVGKETYQMMKNPWVWGASELTDILLAMTQPGEEDQVRAQLTPDEFAALVTSNLSDARANSRGRTMIKSRLEAGDLDFFKSPDFLRKFASGDSPMAQMMRGMGVQNAMVQAKGFWSMAQDPEKMIKPSILLNYTKNMMDMARGKNHPFQNEFDQFMSSLNLKQGEDIFKFFGKGGRFRSMSLNDQQKFYKPLANLVLKTWDVHPELGKMRQEFRTVRDLMGPTARKGSPWEQSMDEIAASQSVGRFLGRNRRIKQPKGMMQMLMFDPLMMATGGRVDKPILAVVGESGPEDVVPQSLTRQLPTGEIAYDPENLPDWRTSMPATAPTQQLVEERGGYGYGGGQGGGGSHYETYEIGPGVQGRRPAPRPVVSPRRAMGAGMGQGGGGGYFNAPPPAAPGGREPLRKEIVSFAQPITEKLVAQYELLADNLGKYNDRLVEMVDSGGTIVDVEGEFADVLTAATNVYPRIIGQRQRVKSMGFRYQLQQEEAGKTITSKGAQILAEMRQSRPQDISGIEMGLASRLGTAAGELFASGLVEADPTGSPTMMQMASEIGGRATRGARQRTQEAAFASRWSEMMVQRGVTRQRFSAERAGRGRAQAALAGPGEEFAQLRQYQDIQQQVRGKYQRWSDLQQEFRTSPSAARRVTPEMNQLAAEMLNLRNEARELAPAIKDSREGFIAHRDTLGREMKNLQSLGRQTWGQMRHLERRIDRGGMAPGDKEILEKQYGRLEKQYGMYEQSFRIRAGAKARADELAGAFRVPGVSIPGVSERGTVAPQTWYQRMAGRRPMMEDVFYKSQMLNQAFYQIGGPLMQARQEYLGAQFARGQAQYALGYGGMSSDVIASQVQAANMARARVAIGKGVEGSTTMRVIQYLAAQAGERPEAAASFGGIATNALALGGLTIGGMTAARGIGSLLSGISAMGGAAGIGTSIAGAGGLTGGLATVGSAGVLAAAPVVGAGISMGGYELIRALGGFEAMGMKGHQQTSAVQSLKQSSAGLGLGLWSVPAAVGAGFGALTGQGSFEELFTESMAGVAKPLSEFAYGPPGGAAAKDQVYRMSIAGVERGAFDELLKGMEDSITQGLQAPGSPFAPGELEQLTRMYADVTGLRGADFTGEARDMFVQGLVESFQAGVSPTEFMDIMQKIPSAAGVAPGSAQQMQIAGWVQQGSMFERQRRLEALQAVGQGADIFNLDRVALAQQYQSALEQTGSYFQAGVQMERYAPRTEYGWSQLAYDAGQPGMAIYSQEEPWLRRGYRERQDFERAGRYREAATQLGVDLGTGYIGVGRQDWELDIAQQKLDLEAEFWDFRQDKRQADFDLGQRQFELTRRQMEFNIDRAEEQYAMQEKYQRRSYEINLQLFDLQTQWRYDDLNKQEQRLDTQRGWEVQGQGLNRYAFNLQSGWQLEDMQRGLRYATGRQRLDIQRQMGRSNILQNIQRQRMMMQEMQSQTRYEWGGEDIETQRERWGIQRPLQREQMVGSFEMWEQNQQAQEKNIQLMRDQLQLYEDRNTINNEFYARDTELSTRQHEMDMMYAQQRLAWQQDDLQWAKERAVQGERLLEIEQAVAEAQMMRAYVMAMGTGNVEQAEGIKEMMALLNQRQGEGLNGEAMNLPEVKERGSGESSIYDLQIKQAEMAVAQIENASALQSLAEERNSQLAEQTAMLAVISAVLNEGSGKKLVIDMDALREEGGFITVADLNETYH